MSQHDCGTLHFGDSVMIQSQQTQGWLVTNLNDRIVSNDEAYAVTATNSDIGPVARSVFIIEKAAECGDSMVRYG